MTWLPAAFWKILAGPFSRLPVLVALLWPLCAWSGPGIELMWDSSPDASVAGYKIYYGTASRSYTSQVDAGKVTSISITLPAYDTTYYLAATTYDAYGVESDFSNEATCLVAGTVVSNPPPVVYTAPTIAAIGNVSIAENAGSQTVNLSGISPGSGTSLTIMASSSNPALIPHPTISHAGTNATGSLSFTPIAYANGSAQITVTVNNGQPTNNLATRTFTVNVASVNQAPTLNALGNLAINYSPATQTVNLSGITSGATNENQTLTVTASSSNTKLIPNPTVSYSSPNATGSLSFKPALNTNGSAIITVTVKDGGSSDNSVTRTFTVTVSPVYQAPTLAAIGNISIAENAGAQTVNLSGVTTGSGAALTITTSSSNPALIPHPTVNYTSPNTNGSLSFTPVANANGSAQITVTVNNGQPTNNLATRTFTVNIAAVNQAPTLNALGNLAINYSPVTQTVNLSGITSGATNESQTLTVTASSSNPALIPNPTVSYVSPNTNGSLTFSPALNTNGSATITVSVNDGGASNNILARTFTVTVSPVYQAPALAAIGNVSIAENAGAQTVNLSGITTGSGSALTITASSSSPALIPHPTVNYTSPNTNGSLSFAPAANANGSAVVTVTVNNGQPTNNLATRSFTVTVSTGNQAPTLNSLSDLVLSYNSSSRLVNLSGIGSGSASEKQTLTVTASSSNPTLIPKPTVSYSNPNTVGSLTLKPATNTSGSAVITVTVNDGAAANNTCTRTFKVTVPGLSQSPSLSAISDVAIEENAGTQTVSLSDISPGSGQSLTIAASSSNPALIPHPAVNHASPDTTGSLTFTPAANTSGSAVITVTVNNGEPTNNLASQSFTVNVAAVNQAPTLNALSDLTLDYGSPAQTVSLSGIGSGAADEFQPLTVKAVSSNTKLIPHPSVSYSSPLATGTLTLKPAANATGPAIITVTVNDGGASNNVVTQTFTVNIDPKTDSPTTLKLTKQPKSQVVITGKTAKLEVGASGTGKLKYQWKCNGTNIAKATGPKLNLKKCSARHAGIYSVTVSDAGGSVSSMPAALVVSPTPAAALTTAERSNGNFSFNVVGVDGYSYAVQTSEDFIHWTSVQTNTAPFSFVDTNAGQAERRFYRTVCLTP